MGKACGQIFVFLRRKTKEIFSGGGDTSEGLAGHDGAADAFRR